MMLVSVVIPVYNVEGYLKECIDSILNQSHIDIEVILVDDGSTDGSGDIADEYKNKDSRIRVVHKDNEGVSIARNIGLKLATGQFVVFVDADDSISDDFIENLVNDAIQNKVSIVTTPKAHIIDNGASYDDLEVISSENAIERMFYGFLEKSDNGVQLFDRNLLVENSILFDSTKKVGEDFDFFVRALTKTNKVAIDYRKMYYYRPNPTSVMNQNINKGLMESVSGFSDLGDSLVDKWPGLKLAVDVKRFGDSVSLMMRSYYVRSEWAEDYQKLEYNTRSLKWSVLANDRTRKKVRIAALAYCILGNKIATIALRRIKK